MDQQNKRLTDREEANGKLDGFDNLDNYLLLHFSLEFTIEIDDQNNIGNQLKKMIGKKISLLKLGDQYYLKELQEGER
jgi:hypothetical protein